MDDLDRGVREHRRGVVPTAVGAAGAATCGAGLLHERPPSGRVPPVTRRGELGEQPLVQRADGVDVDHHLEHHPVLLDPRARGLTVALTWWSGGRRARTGALVQRHDSGADHTEDSYDASKEPTIEVMPGACGSRERQGGVVMLAGDDPVAESATAAVQTGDLDRLGRLLRDHPELATARIGDRGMSRTLLHAATDWPGHYPNVAEIIGMLVRAGADVNARFHGPHAETPLHWAASSDDVDALDALLDAGADIEASGAVLGGGSPLADACGFGQWHAARRLVGRGARTRLKDAAALGLMDRIEAAFSAEPIPSSHDVTEALWSACHGGQRQAAEYLIGRGADANWIGWDDLTPLDVATQADASELVEWLRSQGAKSGSELKA